MASLISSLVSGLLSSALKVVCGVARGREVNFGEVLSRHIDDTVVCNMNLENEGSYILMNLWLKRSVKGLSSLGKRGKIS